MVKYILLVVVGLVVIMGGANLLTDGASALARKFKIPQIIIGLTIVAFGTSAPELAVSIVSGIEGNGGIAIGNVIGSNIFNVLAILGITALIHPLPVHLNSVRFDIPIAILAACILLVVLSDMALDGLPPMVTRVESIILTIMGILFLLYTIYMGKNGQDETPEVPAKEIHWAVSTLMIVAGLGALVVGGNIFVNNASAIAKDIGVSDTLIGLTLVAWGTSLPELATSIVAASKKNTGIAVGNVVGSNIFNIFFVLGISGTIRPLRDLTFTTLDIWMQLVAIIIAFGFALFWGKREINRAEGLMMLIVFVAYNAVLISNAL
mgnify:CR=1 FL=1